MDISVAMTTYNGERYLRPQLESIISQSLTPEEIVVCDDGSTDDTHRILNSFEKKYPDIIRIFKNNSNLGVTKNFEKAINKCSGELIAIADQDDIWKQNKLEVQLQTMQTQDVSFLCHNSILIGADVFEKPECGIQNQTLWETLHSPHRPNFSDKPQSLFRELLQRNFVQGASIMFDQNLKRYFLPIPDMWQYDYFIAIIAHVMVGIYDIEAPLLYYRQHDEQDLGAVSSSIKKFEREVRRGYEEYQRRTSAWQSLHDRLSGISGDKMHLDKPYVLEEIVTITKYMNERAKIHDPTRSRFDRFITWVENNSKFLHATYGHPAFAVSDLFGVLK